MQYFPFVVTLSIIISYISLPTLATILAVELQHENGNPMDLREAEAFIKHSKLNQQNEENLNYEAKILSGIDALPGWYAIAIEGLSNISPNDNDNDDDGNISNGRKKDESKDKILKRKRDEIESILLEHHSSNIKQSHWQQPRPLQRRSSNNDLYFDKQWYIVRFPFLFILSVTITEAKNRERERKVDKEFFLKKQRSLSSPTFSCHLYRMVTLH